MFGLRRQYFRPSIISNLVSSIIIFIRMFLKDFGEIWNVSSEPWTKTRNKSELLAKCNLVAFVAFLFGSCIISVTCFHLEYRKANFDKPLSVSV